MSPAISSAIAARDGVSRGAESWVAPAAIYSAFSIAVFVVQGSQPPLGPDHLSYIQLADSILAACPNGEYWRETSSIRFYGVLLAYLHGWTGSHVLSMKVVLAVFSVLFLLASQLFFGLFTASRWQAILFALLSGFAVSFGFASWGVTDSTALLPRTLVAPIVMVSMWLWFRFDGHPAKYLAFPLLVLGSLMHLSTFYVIGVLILLEVWDFVALRRVRLDRQVPACALALLFAGLLLVGLEYVGVANKSASQWLPEMLRSIGLSVPNIQKVESSTLKVCSAVPANAARTRRPSRTKPAVQAATPAPAAPASRPVPMTAQHAWAAELSLRPWRNMPLPLANVANALSSSLLILLLAAAGMWAARNRGFSRVDRLMVALFFAVPAFAFLPQTALWILRSFTSIYPATIEEVRAFSLIMIPTLYFILVLFSRVLESGRPRAALEAGAVAVAVLALPLLMKNVPHWAREGILSTMVALCVVDAGNESGLANARAALGIFPGSSSLYYSTQGVRAWLERNTPRQARILTDRDDLVLLRDRVILGPRQVAVNVYKGGFGEASLFLRTSQAMAARDIARLEEIATSHDADFIVVGWPVESAAYSDGTFSVLSLGKVRPEARP
jgi:hypothetical protein